MVIGARERLCGRCSDEKAPRRRIYLHFMLRRGWHCQFLEENLKTPLPRKFHEGGHALGGMPQKSRDFAQPVSGGS